MFLHPVGPVGGSCHSDDLVVQPPEYEEDLAQLKPIGLNKFTRLYAAQTTPLYPRLSAQDGGEVLAQDRAETFNFLPISVILIPLVCRLLSQDVSLDIHLFSYFTTTKVI
jgi:hypothetical protein